MKKFFTYVSMQKPDDLKKLNYKPVGNDELNPDLEVFFPISMLIDCYVDKDDVIAVVCIIERKNENIEANFETLKKEVGMVCAEKDAEVNFVPVYSDKSESAASHLHTFKGLIDTVEDGDDIFVCCTYGTKPIPIIEMMAMNYAYRLGDNVSIKSLVYGKVERQGRDIVGAYLYDISALFYMNQIVNSLAEQKIKNPERILKNMLAIEDPSDEEE